MKTKTFAKMALIVGLSLTSILEVTGLDNQKKDIEGRVTTEDAMLMMDGVGYPDWYIPQGDRQKIIDYAATLKMDGIGFSTGYPYEDMEKLRQQYEKQLKASYEHSLTDSTYKSPLFE